MKFKVLIAPLVFGIAIATPGIAQAEYNYDQVVPEGRWEWEVATSSDDGMDDARFWLPGESEENENDDVVNDAFDDFGTYSVDGVEFDTSSTNGDIVGGQIIFPGTGELTGNVAWRISNNVWTQELTSSTSGALLIEGDLGSDRDTTWRTQGSYFISYEDDDGYVDDDPIIVWETDGTIKSQNNVSYINGEDDVKVQKNGTSLTLTIYLYPHINDESLDIDAYFTLFEKWLNENKLRTDIFTTSFTPAAPAQRVEVVNVRQSSNLLFSASQFGSDRLSDPDGGLRALVDTLMAKYGNLLS